MGLPFWPHQPSRGADTRRDSPPPPPAGLSGTTKAVEPTRYVRVLWAAVSRASQKVRKNVKGDFVFAKCYCRCLEIHSGDERTMIDELKVLIPTSVLDKSGAVFYSGRAAFNAPSPLYILGLNPGGSPEVPANGTVKKHTEKVLNGKHNWSEYQDESWWEGHKPGTSGMQPRVLHLLCSLKLDPQKIPASNIIFLRSARERDIKKQFRQLAELCWPFHKAVIERLGVRVVLCFGKKAGEFVRNKLNATNLVGVFQENNNRRWTSRSYTRPNENNGIAVVVATHPSISDWTNRATDPSDLVLEMLQRSAL